MPINDEVNEEQFNNETHSLLGNSTMLDGIASENESRIIDDHIAITNTQEIQSAQVDAQRMTTMTISTGKNVEQSLERQFA